MRAVYNERESEWIAGDPERKAEILAAIGDVLIADVAADLAEQSWEAIRTAKRTHHALQGLVRYFTDVNDGDRRQLVERMIAGGKTPHEMMETRAVLNRECEEIENKFKRLGERLRDDADATETIG